MPEEIPHLGSAMIHPTKRSGLAQFAVVLVVLLSLGAVATQASAIPVPFIGTISPDAVASGGAAFTLTVTGTGFVNSSVVSFGSTALATTYVSGTKVTAAVTAPLIANSGAGSITVSTPGTPTLTSNAVFLNLGASSSSLNLVNTPLTAQDSPITAAQGDFNGDGKVDMVAANWQGDSLSIFLGNGDGTYQTPETISLAGVSALPIGLVVGDFNNDGKTDIAVGYESGTGVSVLLGNGDGTFQAPQVTAAGDDSYALAVGDFNGDGLLDMAVSNYSEGTVNILLGKGDGTFQTAVSIPTTSSGNWFIQVADLNGDGKLDLVTCDYEGVNISVLLGNGDGTFQSGVTYTTGQTVVGVAIGDFDGDGKLDLIASSDSDTNAYLLLGNGDGTFQGATAIAVGASNQEIASGDFNNDGKLDFAIITDSGNVETVLGNGDGTFQAAQSFAASGGGGYDLVVGNFGNTGGLGIAVPAFGTSVVDLLIETVTLTPATNDFGNQALSLPSAPQVFTLTNNTSQSTTISGIAFSGTNASDFGDTTTCGASLASAASCTITVTFTPAAMGAATATLTVTDNAPGGSQTATLTGSGIDAPVVTLSSPSLSFSSSGVGVATAAQSVTISNIGSATLNIASIAVTGVNSADFGETTTCGATLAMSANCVVNVTFTPGASGARVAAVTLTDDAANSPQLIALTGSVAVAATANLSSPSITFNGQVVGSTSAGQSVTLSNTGNSALAVTGVAVSGANSGDFAVTNNCGVSVAGGASCVINATFKPTAGGTRTATITVTDSATSGTQTIALHGTGEDFSMAFTGGSTVASGLSENLTLTVTPQGGFTGTVALSCSGAPALSTCTVSPTSVTLNGTTAVTSTFTLSTGGTAASILPNVPPTKFPPVAVRWGTLFAALLMLAMAVLGLKAPKGRTLRPAALSFGVLLLLVSVGMSACVGVTKHETIPTTAPGTYTLTATGTSGSLTNTATIGITVSK
jgi:FG-GAP-like repeat/Abnormal spindle-like microcephaly-assoc'd, ASPM-SPD-2-Hydin